MSRRRRSRPRSRSGPPPKPGPEFERFRRRLSYPSELPITDHRDELVEMLASEQVIIVAGETGSGKSTQLPKLCVEAGRGTGGLIGHTQPRRLAARSIAERVAEETNTSLGDTVGYAVRFNERIGPTTRIKLMTDGILLAELQRDQLLRRYDTIIIDEAHERSLNIDFLLGYLKQILPRRPELHVVVTSATIDTERFSHHFDDAPIIEVSGRTYPVEIRYRPYDEPGAADGWDPEEPLSQAEAITRAVRSLIREGPGDMLVFLPGERDIRETAEALTELNLHDTEIFPLFARLSAADQHRVFRPHPGRRIVLATNVAETSLTVPGIRYVIDPGTARISRYNKRTKMQRLPIEPVSQASADQRAGRCGRIGPGICVRLYSEADFESRDEFTEPEIQRTNLASVILQMAALDLGDIDSFPFVDPPDRRSIGDGIALLEELDALDPEHEGTRDWLTPMGRELARLPVDPRFARMLIEAADHGALAEVLIIVAALSIQDPRERPRDDDGQATALHRRFEHEDSDFLTLLELWRYLEKQRSKLSSNQFRRLCRREYLNHNRVREWQDTRNQLERMTRELGYRTSGNRAKAETVHRCLLSGLLSHVGLKDAASDKADRRAGGGRSGRGRSRRPLVEFMGARGSRFRIARTSALAKSPPNWVMAAELIETNRLWAHTVGPIDPRWIEELGYYLVTRSYDTPSWSAADGVAYTIERITLYGLPVVSGRRITVGSVNPAQGRELFIHHALVEDEWEAGYDFVVHNRELRAELAELERRARRRDLTTENQALHAFFDHRLPDDITSAAHFDTWWRTRRESEPRLLHLTIDQLLAEGAELADPADFPDFWTVDGESEGRGPTLELAYEFDGASPLDGLSVHVPVEVLNQLEAIPFQWLVPGYRPELVEALIRSLPKAKRKDLAPIGHTVDRVLAELHGGDRIQVGVRPLGVALTRILGPMTGVEITPDDFDWDRVPDHLRPMFRVIDADRRLLAEGKDLDAVKDLMATHTREAISELSSRSTDLERSGITTWDFGSLPPVVEPEGTNIKAYPGLVDDGDSVSIRLFPTEDEQHEATWLGARRLLRLHLASPVRTLDRLLAQQTKFALVDPPVQSKADWYNDAIDCALDEIMVEAGGPPRDEAGFELLVAATRARARDDLAAVARIMDRLVPGLVELTSRIERLESSDGLGPSVSDAIAHGHRLAYPGLLTGFGMPRLDDLVRYVDGLSHRIDKLIENPDLDVRKTAELIGVERRHAEEVAERGLTPALEDLQWLLEELRLATFAQHLRNPKSPKVSARRIERALAAVAD